MMNDISEAAASREAVQKAKCPPGGDRALWTCPIDILKRIEEHKDLKVDDKKEIVNIINNEQDVWKLLETLYGIFFKYVDDDDGSKGVYILPISLRTLIVDIMNSLPGKNVIIQTGRTSMSNCKLEENLVKNLSQNNKLTSTCMAMDLCIGGMIVVPGIITGIASAGMKSHKHGTEEHTIFDNVCEVVSFFVEACKSKQIIVLYSDAQRLSRLPDKCIERRNQLKDLGAMVKFGKQFVEDEDEPYLDDYLYDWRKELDADNERSNKPNSRDCAIELRSKPSYKQYLPVHNAIVEEAKVIEKETLKSCTEKADNKGVYVPRKDTKVSIFLEAGVALGETITDLDIDTKEWKGTVDTLMDDPSSSNVNSVADDFCKKVEESNVMGNQDIPLFFNRMTPMVQGGKRIVNRIEIDVGGGRHSNYQIALNRSTLAHAYNGDPPTNIAIVTMHRERGKMYAKDIAQLATSIASKNHSDLVMTITTRLSNKHPLVMFIHRLCISTDTRYLLSLGHGLAISDVASAEESRKAEGGTTTNFTAKKFIPKEGSIATHIITASGLHKFENAAVDNDVPDSKPSATATKKPAAKVAAKEPATKPNKVSTKKTPRRR